MKCWKTFFYGRREKSKNHTNYRDYILYKYFLFAIWAVVHVLNQPRRSLYQQGSHKSTPLLFFASHLTLRKVRWTIETQNMQKVRLHWRKNPWIPGCNIQQVIRNDSKKLPLSLLYPNRFLNFNLLVWWRFLISALKHSKVAIFSSKCHSHFSAFFSFFFSWKIIRLSKSNTYLSFKPLTIKTYV